MKTAYSYIRFSCGEQATGSSLERQKKSEVLIQEKGWKLDDKLKMHDLGVSALKKKNLTAVAALGQFLALAKDDKIRKGSVLVVEHLDRLTRAEVTIAMQLFLDIINAGIMIVSTTPTYREYTKAEIDKSPFLMMEIVMGFIAANEYSKNIQTRVAYSWTKRRANKDTAAITGKAPCWLQLNKQTKKFDFIPEKKKIVERLLKMSLVDGLGTQRICRILNEEKIPSISNKPKHKTDTKWATSFIVQILTNPALYGSFFPTVLQDDVPRKIGEEWNDYYPAIITREQFQKLTALRQSRSGGRNGKRPEDTANIFQGLIKTLGGEKFHKIKKNIPRIAPASFRDGSNPLSFPFDPLERFLLQVLAVDIQLSDIGLAVDSPISKSEALRSQLSAMETKLIKLQAAYKTSPDSDVLIQMILSFEADKAKLQTEINTEESKTVSQPSTELAEIKTLLAKSNESESRSKLKVIIRSLVSDIRMVIFGIKGSPLKTAEIQIYFRQGGFATCSITCEADKIISTIRTRNWSCNEDFREKSSRLTRYMEIRETFYLALYQQYFDTRCKRANNTDPVGDFISQYAHLPC